MLSLTAATIADAHHFRDEFECSEMQPFYFLLGWLCTLSCSMSRAVGEPKVA